MSFLQTPNTKVYFETFSEVSGPWVTLINGFSRSSQDFKAMARFLEKSGYRVLILDNRGAGKTETQGRFSLADIRQDVVALWDHLGITQSHVLGISYGGVITQGLALEYGPRVSSAALVSTTPSNKFIHYAIKLHEETDPEKIRTQVLDYFSKDFANNNQVLVKSLVKDTSQAFLDPARRARAAAQRAAMGEFDFTDSLHKIDCPVLVLHGGADAIITVQAAETVAAKIRNVTLEVFSGVGHLLLAECPKKLYERYLDFLKHVGN